MPPLKLASKNIIEKRLPEIRQRISHLSDIARFKGLDDVSAQLLWIELDCRRIRDEIWREENQLVMEVENGTNSP